MATLNLTAYHASRSGGFLQVIFTFSKPAPFPPRSVEIKNTADALDALEAYKADAIAADVPLVVSMSLKRGDRAPRGFRAASEKPAYHPVNV